MIYADNAATTAMSPAAVRDMLTFTVGAYGNPSSIPDNFFQLAICDPPYGIGHDGQRKRVHNNRKHNRKFHARKGWDTEPPTPEYFRELERVSENQIIFRKLHRLLLNGDRRSRGLFKAFGKSSKRWQPPSWG